MDLKPLGDAIVRRRKLLGITQRELADLAGCSEPFVNQLEGGKPTVRLDKVIAVLSAIGLEFRLVTGKQGIQIDTTV